MAVFIELFLLGVGLSMDAFAVSVCKGLGMRKLNKKQAVIIGLYFGGFQALMPLIGWLLGSQFQKYITSIDHWIAFILLAVIGINMIRESRGAAEKLTDSFTFRSMLPLAIATSIDALAVGVTFAFLNVAIIPAILIIGITTFVLSAIGVRIGSVFGSKYRSSFRFVLFESQLTLVVDALPNDQFYHLTFGFQVRISN